MAVSASVSLSAAASRSPPIRQPAFSSDVRTLTRRGPVASSATAGDTGASGASSSTVGAACAETAVGLLQGPHGREVRAAVLAMWDGDSGPGLIAALRRDAPDLPIIVLADSGSVAMISECTGATARRPSLPPR